jgi:hypothetical protein
MRVTATHVYPVTPQNGLVAFANVVLDGALNLCGIGVYERMDGTGYRLTYPLKGKSYAFHPLTPPPNPPRYCSLSARWRLFKTRA